MAQILYACSQHKLHPIIAKIVHQRVGRLHVGMAYAPSLHGESGDLYFYYFLTLHSALYFFAFSFGNHSLSSFRSE